VNLRTARRSRRQLRTSGPRFPTMPGCSERSRGDRCLVTVYRTAKLARLDCARISDGKIAFDAARAPDERVYLLDPPVCVRPTTGATLWSSNIALRSCARLVRAAERHRPLRPARSHRPPTAQPGRFAWASTKSSSPGVSLPLSPLPRRRQARNGCARYLGELALEGAIRHVGAYITRGGPVAADECCARSPWTRP
jgi:hypothetical protein